eukprot:6491197-Amphidinium_carterae.2
MMNTGEPFIRTKIDRGDMSGDGTELLHHQWDRKWNYGLLPATGLVVQEVALKRCTGYPPQHMWMIASTDSPQHDNDLRLEHTRKHGD